MEYSSLREYKDKAPCETLSHLQKKLNDWNLKYKLCVGTNNITKSTYLEILNTRFKSEGKGITLEYAEASAFGELFERMLNCVYYRMNVSKLQKSGHESHTFTYHTMSQAKNVIESCLNYANSFDSKLLENIMTYLEEVQGKQSILCERFVAISGEEISIPCSYVDLLYGTNGMAAGNTREEALVQGLSEIIERYVIDLILKSKIELINVTEDVKSKYEIVNKCFQSVRENLEIDMILYQCCFGVDIPAYALVYINKEEGKYIVKVGVHPVGGIAIERCFTELFQGKSERQLTGLSPIYNCDILGQTNKNNIYKNGTGNYPNSIFQAYGNTRKEIDYSNSSSNKIMLDYMMRKIERMGYDVLISETSIDSFYSFHIIVPGLSEVIEYNTLKHNLEQYIKFARLKNVLKESYDQNWKGIDAERIHIYLNEYKNDLFTSLDKVIESDCNLQKKKLENVCLMDVMMFCCSVLGKKEELLRCARGYINNIGIIKDNKRRKEKEKFLSCLISVLKYGVEFTHLIFNEDIINDVKYNLSKDLIPTIKKITCDECDFKDTSFCDSVIEKNVLSIIFSEYNTSI